MDRHLLSTCLHQMEAIVYMYCIWYLLVLHFLLLFQTSWEKRRPNSLDFVSHSRTCFANWGWSQEISLQGNKKVGGVFVEARNYSSWCVEFVQLQFGYSSCSKISCHYQGNLCAFQTGMTFCIGLKQLLCTGLGPVASHIPTKSQKMKDSHYKIWELLVWRARLNPGFCQALFSVYVPLLLNWSGYGSSSV